MGDSLSPRLGAYGLELVPPLSPAHLVPVSEGSPAVEVIRHDHGPPPARNRFDDSVFEFSFGRDGGLLVVADPPSAAFRMREPLSEAELVHPYLAPVGGAFAWWAGREAFHAGAFAAGDAVWAMLGDKGAGKSSMLAGLALAGYDVICDDLLVVDAGRALTGPRCLDLRPGAARHLGVGQLTVRGGQDRWRWSLGPVPPARPLAGWIFLEWGERVDAARVNGSERVSRLAHHRALFIPPRQPSILVELAALPAWEFRRPCDWDALPRTIDALLELTAH